MLGDAINREAKEVDPNPGGRPSREVCAQDGGEARDGAEDSGAGSHRPCLCGQDSLQLSDDSLFDKGITRNSQPAAGLRFCEKK